MAIDWSLGQVGGSPLDALRYFGQAQDDAFAMRARQDQLAKQQQQNALRQQQLAARPAIQQQLSAGNFEGARTAAVGAGDIDYAEAIGKLSADHQKRLADEAEIMGRTAYQLRNVPQQQRAAALQQLAPQLKATGYFTDDELAAAAADLSDAALDRYVGIATTLKDQIAAAKPIQLSDGEELRDPRNGNIIASNPKDADYVFDPESGDWLKKPGTGQGTPSPALPGPANSPSPIIPSAAGPQREVAQVLTSSGMPGPVVAGFLGNFEVEGGYGGARGDGGTAAGIAQWRGPRQENFRAVMGKGVSQATPAEQAQYVAWEMANPTHPSVGMSVAARDSILSAQSPSEAAALIDRHYERSSGAARNARMSAAQSFMSTQDVPQQGGGSPDRIPSGRGPKRQQAPSGYEFGQGGGLQPQRGGPADPNNVKETRSAEMDMRKEFTSLAEVKDFKIVRPAYQQIKALVTKKNPTAADDIALIYSFMKILDPGSVVRETEYATAQNAAGVPERVRNIYNRTLTGERLGPEQRTNFLGAASSAYDTRRKAYNDQAQYYRDLAKDYQLNGSRVAPLYLTADELRSRQSGATKPGADLRKKYGLR